MPYADPEKRREYGREWMKRNPDKARAACADGASDIRTLTPDCWLIAELPRANRAISSTISFMNAGTRTGTASRSSQALASVMAMPSSRVVG